MLATLERNQHIKLAHINPESYSRVEQQNEGGPSYCSMWFIGLEFAKTEKLNVDLTYDIQNFSTNLNRIATNCKVLKEGMVLDARHVKRKELHQYLSPSLLKRERKFSGNVSKNGMNDRKRLSDGSGGTENKKPRISNEVRNFLYCTFCIRHISLLSY